VLAAAAARVFVRRAVMTIRVAMRVEDEAIMPGERRSASNLFAV